ncbi:hypothetical protein BGZ51_003358 [Haplosporangium sp. Z 767]|nr:hypothetical protein BGZ50_008906 [Haplosporangium sp. Z 11]KAF9184390.1 hypothetical protein BGZ51_003358 [Haplosporangium sp. Z 767]
MSLQVVRPVGNLERYNITRSNLNIYHNVVIGNRLQPLHSDAHYPSTLHSSDLQQQWVQFLLGPVTRLVDHHPSLAMVLGDHLTGSPMFLRLPTIDLSSLVHVTPIKRFQNIAQVMERENNTPFDLANKEIPLWRLVVAPIEEDPASFYLLYTFHHVIGDGRSGMALTEQLIQQLNLQAQTRNARCIFSDSFKSAVIEVTSSRPMPDSIESHVDCYPSIRTLLAEASRALFLPGFMKKALEAPYWAGEIDSSLDIPNETELALLQFTPDETRAIVAAAKRRSTTVQSIFYTASIFSVQSIFLSATSSPSNRKTESLTFATPVSLRTLLSNTKIAPEDQGNYTSEILHNNIRIVDTTSFWKMTHAYRKEVIQETQTALGVQRLLEHFGMLNLLSKKDGAWEEFMANRVKKDQHGRKASIKLSNLGQGWKNTSAAAAISTLADKGPVQNVKGEDTEFSVQDAVFSQSSGVTASALTMNAATANGIMTLTVTWQRAAFHGRCRGELFMSEFKRMLMEAIADAREDYLFADAKPKQLVDRRV